MTTWKVDYYEMSSLSLASYAYLFPCESEKPDLQRKKRIKGSVGFYPVSTDGLKTAEKF
jgi:hypothetical protein